MNADNIIRRMHKHMEVARKSGTLNDFMAGYYTGILDALAIEACTKESFDLSRTFYEEVKAMREAA